MKDNPELIQLRLAEKWDGKLPTMSMGGENGVSLFDVTRLLDSNGNSRSRHHSRSRRDAETRIYVPAIEI